MPVFLSNVDDYLAPSQACVNPMFSDGVNTKNEDEKTKPVVSEVVPRKRTTVRRKVGVKAPALEPIAKPKETATLSMADCLACSGCVTSAETVLVEQHSLSTLKEKLKTITPTTVVVVTISPASWTDVARHLKITNNNTALFRRQLTTALQKSCRANVVLDADVPLQWSWQEAAREFCQAYQERRSLTEKSTNIKTPLPSVALSSTKSQQYDQNATVTTHTTRSTTHLPLVSATCPALVCLVEKSHPAIVPHLSTTKSSMAMAGQYVKAAAADTKDILHIAIMPCHDKKLEASRKDFTSEDVADVDLVLTSNEWIQLMGQATQTKGDGNNTDESSSNDVDVIRTYIESLEPAESILSMQQQQQNMFDGNSKALLVESRRCAASDSDGDDLMDIDTTTAAAATNDFFAYGSGGYADFIFRYATQHLFGFAIPSSSDLPWKPVGSSSNNGGPKKVVSARVAASRKKDYHGVTLYQLEDGTYSMTETTGRSVLRFATAYGFQTLQRILQPLDDTSNTKALEFDYIEAMACPSGCINGGGQIRLMERESPKETRQRVAATKERFQVAYHDSKTANDDIYIATCPSGPFGPEAQLQLHTRYHVVPPLQHTLGAAAGVAVQDTLW